LTDGARGLDIVRILEASSASLKLNGAPIELGQGTAGKPAPSQPQHPASASIGSRSPLATGNSRSIGPAR
jgi:hypothetical protein